MPPNRAIYSKDGEMVDIVVGTFFICDAPLSSDTFHSLSEAQMKKYEEMFHDLERFYWTAEGVQAHKIRHSREQER